MNWLALGLLALGAYLVGAFPTAYVICKRQGVNIFEIGSGNMGATNVARALGGGPAILTLVIDAIKGALPVVAGQLLIPEDPTLGGMVAALGAMVGHSWSVWILMLTGELRGGKAAATTLGTWIALTPWYVTLGCVAIAALTTAQTRMVSLAVLLTIGVGTAWVLLLAAQQVVAPTLGVYAVLACALSFYNHRSNIKRLRAGTERKIGQSTKKV